jgi:selenide,water dikinase
MKVEKLQKIVLVGGGHSHITVLEQFANHPLSDSQLTLVTDSQTTIYSGMVPGFVAGQYRQEELEIDIKKLAQQAKAQVVISKAVKIDTQERKILLANGLPIRYDIASFNIGATMAGRYLPGIHQHTTKTRPLGLFIKQVDKILQAAQKHYSTTTPFRVVVVGAGMGGIELAFTLQQRLQQNVSTTVQVLILQNKPRILDHYSDSLAHRVHQLGKERNIKIQCNRKVVAVEPNTVILEDGKCIHCQAVLWVTGPDSHPIFKESGLSTDDLGFVRVHSTLQIENQNNLFATGDCATLTDYPQTPKAGVYAIRQGTYITRNIRSLLSGKPLHIYRPQKDFLALINLGNGRALGTKWGQLVEGKWVMTLKDRIDRSFVKRFQALT